MTDELNEQNVYQALNAEDDRFFSEVLQSDEFKLINDEPFNQEDLLQYLLTKLLPLYAETCVLVNFIGGPASGKTTLCSKISKVLTEKGHLTADTRTDAYALYTREERNKRLKEGTDTPLSLKAKDYLNTRIIPAVLKGEEIKIPEYDEKTGEAMIVGEDNFLHSLPAQLHFLFVEGDFNLLQHADLTIYNHMQMKDRCEIRIKRDTLEREGYGDATAIEKSFYSRVTGQYYEYTRSIVNDAGILIVSHVSLSKLENNKSINITYSVYERNHL